MLNVEIILAVAMNHGVCDALQSCLECRWEHSKHFGYKQPNAPCGLCPYTEAWKYCLSISETARCACAKIAAPTQKGRPV